MLKRSRKKPSAEDLAGTHEVAQLLGISRQRVHQLSSDGSFPKPVAELAAGLIWRGSDIKKWRDEMRPSTDRGPNGKGPNPPQRDPDRPQDDPWDAEAIRYLLGKLGNGQWTRGNLMECMREQGNRLKNQPDKVREAAALAKLYGVERRPDPGGKTIHFFRTDPDAPFPYPVSAAERRTILRDTKRTL